MDNIGIIKSKFKSCAYLAIECMSAVGIAEQDVIFKHHIENAKTHGLMPNDLKVIRTTLSDYGFVMQSSCIEGFGIKKVIEQFSKLDMCATVLLSIGSCENLGGYMMIIHINGNKVYAPYCPNPKPMYLESRKVKHIWIRWDDGIDRSPYPRRTVNRCTVKGRKREYENTECYKNFNPNPCNNLIGDCVVRAFAGALDITWNDAVDRLSALGETTINTWYVYSKVLEREGLVYHKPLARNGHKLTGKAFCLEMGRLCNKGERIFAHVGRGHVAAIVPIDGHYKIIDSWDSSSRLIGDFWVKHSDKPILRTKVTRMFCIPFAVGDSLQHPSFGMGIVTNVIPGVVTIDFGANGLRRLGADWVSNNCIRTAA